MQNHLLIATGHWMRSGDGIATVQWASAVLSVVAIATALYAFLAGQRRVLAERINEATRERLVLERTEQERVFKRQHLFSIVLDVLAEAQQILKVDHPSPEQGMVAIDWLPDRGKPLELRAVKGSLEALRLAAAEEVALILAMSRAISILEVAIDPPGWGGRPLGGVPSTTALPLGHFDRSDPKLRHDLLNGKPGTSPELGKRH